MDLYSLALNRDFNQFFDVCVQYDENDQKVMCFTFVPNKEKFLHYHIDLSKEKAKELHQWIEEFLKETTK